MPHRTTAGRPVLDRARRRLLAGTLLGAAALAGSGFAGSASAAVTVGPIDANTGFPASLSDAADGLALMPCTVDLVNCLSARPKPLDPFTLGNFPTAAEVFYWAADPVFSGPLAAAAAGTRFALEGSFVGAPQITAGDQTLFSRMRMRFSLPAGTYRITHPYGVDEYTVTPVAAGLRAINATENSGCLAQPCDLTGASFGRLTTMLRWDDATAPAGFIGTPSTPHTVTGSPTGTNTMTVERQVSAPTDLAPDGVWEVVDSTDKWLLQGQLAGAPPAPVAFASLSASSLAFPGRRADVPSLARSVVLSNTGGAPLVIGSAAVTGANAGDFSLSGTCTGTIPAHGSCTAQIGFTATGAIGPRAANLVLTTNAANAPTLTVPLSGSITEAAPPAPVPPAAIVTQVVAGAQSAGAQSAGAQSAGARPVAGQSPAPAGISSAALRLRSVSLPRTVKLAAARKGVKVAMVLPKGATRVDFVLQRGGHLVRRGSVVRRAGASILTLEVPRRGAYRLTLTPQGSARGVARRIAFQVI